MSGVISPNPKFLGTDNNNEPVVGGKLFTYISGTTTKQTTYNSSVITAGNANSNPVIMDSAGRATVFLDPTLAYKFVFAPSTDTDPPVSPYWTVDGISESVTTNLEVTGTAGETIAVGEHVYLSDGTGGLTAGRWYLTDADLAYKSSSAAALGVSLSALSAGQSGLIRTDGIYDAASGLSAGSIYYLSGTAGAITSAAPSTNPRIVAQAYSTTAYKILYQTAASTDVDISGTAGENLTLNDCAYMSDGSGGKTSGRWYQADPANTYSSSKAAALGFVTATVTTGNAATIRTSGRLTGFAGLTTSSVYYVSTTGAITATPPAEPAAVGVADSTTSLIVKPPNITPYRGIIFYDHTASSGATGGGTDIVSTTIPANAISAAGRMLRFVAHGTTAANGNNKTMTFSFGGSTFFTFPTFAANAFFWTLNIELFRQATSSAQTMTMTLIVASAAGADTVYKSRTTGTKDLTTALAIKATIISGTALGDITFDDGYVEIPFTV